MKNFHHKIRRHEFVTKSHDLQIFYFVTKVYKYSISSQKKKKLNVDDEIRIITK